MTDAYASILRSIHWLVMCGMRRPQLKLLVLSIAMYLVQLACSQQHSTLNSDMMEKRFSFGTPISDWYFAIRANPGWLATKWPYCGFSTSPSMSDIIITCDKRHPPSFSVFALVLPIGQLPALTGQELLMVSRTSGLCGTVQEPATQNATEGMPLTRTGVTCRGSYERPTGYRLLAPDLEPGQPIDLNGGTYYYILEDDKFCTIADTDIAKSSLVCDLNTTAGAMRFSLLPAAFPFASLSSLASGERCGVKSLLQPPPHPLICRRRYGTDTDADASDAEPAELFIEDTPKASVRDKLTIGRTKPTKTPQAHPVQQSKYIKQTQAAISQQRDKKAKQRQAELLSSKRRLLNLTRVASGINEAPWEDEEWTYSLTLTLQKPGSGIVSGTVVGIVTYSPGLVGFPLQQCCPLPESPHIVDCSVVDSDPLPNECWFTLYKNDAKAGDPIQDGDLVTLASKAYSRYCSVTVDGTLLCVSAQPSNATRNLFRFSANFAQCSVNGCGLN